MTLDEWKLISEKLQVIAESEAENPKDRLQAMEILKKLREREMG